MSVSPLNIVSYPITRKPLLPLPPWSQRAIQFLFQWAGEDASLPDFREFLDGAGTVTIGIVTSCERMATGVLAAIVGASASLIEGGGGGEGLN